MPTRFVHINVFVHDMDATIADGGLGGMRPSPPSSRRWLYQSTYSATASSRSSIPCQGPLFRTSSALNRELKASATALS
jgi:hypothetical protein